MVPKRPEDKPAVTRTSSDDHPGLVPNRQFQVGQILAGVILCFMAMGIGASSLISGRWLYLLPALCWVAAAVILFRRAKHTVTYPGWRPAPGTPTKPFLDQLKWLGLVAVLFLAGGGLVVVAGWAADRYGI